MKAQRDACKKIIETRDACVINKLSFPIARTYLISTEICHHH